MFRLLLIAGMAASMALPVRAETVHIGVNGLVCAFCVKGIEKSFKENAATESIKVNMDEKLVTLVTKENQTLDDATIKKIITDAGYSITTIHRQP